MKLNTRFFLKSCYSSLCVFEVLAVRQKFFKVSGQRSRSQGVDEKYSREKEDDTRSCIIYHHDSIECLQIQ